MTDQRIEPRLNVKALDGAMGAVVAGLDVDNIDSDLADELRQAWTNHHVLFFLQLNLSPAQQFRSLGYLAQARRNHRVRW